MKELLASYNKARVYLFGNKVNFILAMIPVVIGVLVYVLLWNWLFNGLLPQGQAWVSTYFSSDTMGDIIYYLLVGLVSVVMYLVVSWTMVLIISLIASPFNDLISSRIEKLARGEEPIKIEEGIKKMMAKLVGTLFNELKKVLMILLFTVIALVLNLIPILVPVGLLITSILFAIQFVDYSWSRHDIPSKKCFQNAKKNWIPYSISGFGFLFLSTIPVVNLFLPSYATSYYTVLWLDLDKKQLEKK